MKQRITWHPMTDEPMYTGVLLYSEQENGIFDGSYIGDDKFQIGKLIADKSQFARWCYRGEFFDRSGLRESLDNQ